MKEEIKRTKKFSIRIKPALHKQVLLETVECEKSLADFFEKLLIKYFEEKEG